MRLPQPLAFAPLPLGTIRPTGWLLRQCRIQADGLTGHLDEVWPDVGPDNLWLGGDSGEGWERGPYYVDGLLPLAHLLGDPGLLAKAQTWVDSFLRFQDEDGWIGPVQAPGYQPFDPWPVTIVAKVLIQHADATGDDAVVPVLLRWCQWLARHLPSAPLYDWGRFRWPDLVMTVLWLHERTGEAWLVDLAETCRRQGYDWVGHFTAFEHTGKSGSWSFETHVVNSAMALKAGAVAWRLTGDDVDLVGSSQAFDVLDRHHGQATGMFTGDECYAGQQPTQGTELCAVAEAMFSCEHLISVTGDARYADRLEQIAYNALPATFTPDMWAHQYDQQANQVLCTVEPRAWTTNDDTANIFGLEPNYGCCTANMHQAWPKLVASAWMRSPDGALVAAVYGPSRVITVIDGRDVVVTQETDYPFAGAVRIRVDAAAPVQLTVVLRVPAWADAISVTTADGESVLEGAGWHRVERLWQPGEELVATIPMEIRRDERPLGGVALRRGPLVLSLRVDESFTELRRVGLGAADWEVRPTTEWRFGLVTGAPFDVATSVVGPVPFSPEDPPVVVTTTGRLLPRWAIESGSAGEHPVDTTDAGPDEPIELIPYGSTNLRVTELPAIDTSIR